MMEQRWSQELSFLVNSVGVSDDGGIVAAGTYYYPYPNTARTTTDGTFGTYCFGADGKERWRHEYSGNEGVYCVAVAGNGDIVAIGGLLSGGLHALTPGTQTRGLVQAFSSDGTPLLDFSNLRSRVNSIALSRDGSVLAGVTIGGELFVFVADTTDGTFPQTPEFAVQGGPRLDMVAVHPTGKWLIASGASGKVHFVTISKTGIDHVYTWTSPVNGIELLACALARNGDAFVAGGKNKIYAFTVASMTADAGPQPVDHFDTPSGGTSDDVRWLAMSADGSLVSVVQNLGHDIAGLLITLSNTAGHLKQLRSPQHLNHNPNSTSIDDAGRFITVADGHPFNSPGTFYLFQASDGRKLAEIPTDQMNWPMVISADGSAVAAGNDDGKVFYFVVETATVPQDVTKEYGTAVLGV